MAIWPRLYWIREDNRYRKIQGRLSEDSRRCEKGLQLAELTRPVLVESCRLPSGFHGDPADQMIVATARHQGAVLVTKDRAIRDYAHVPTVW